MNKFIDISKHQGNINVIDVINKNGLLGAFVRATLGVGIEDTKVRTHYNALKSNGKMRGLYHFSYFNYSDLNTGIEEAKTFVKKCKELKIDKSTYLILDYEDYNINGVDYKVTPNHIKPFINEVEKSYPSNPIIIYANSSTVKRDNLESLGYPLWVANYGENNGKPNTKPSVKKMIAWQYSSVGRLSGYNGDLDVNLFYGDYEQGNNNNNNNNKESFMFDGKQYITKAGKKLSDKYLLGYGEGNKRTMAFKVNEGEKYLVQSLTNGKYVLMANNSFEDDQTPRVGEAMVILDRGDFDNLSYWRDADLGE